MARLPAAQAALLALGLLISAACDAPAASPGQTAAGPSATAERQPGLQTATAVATLTTPPGATAPPESTATPASTITSGPGPATPRIPTPSAVASPADTSATPLPTISLRPAFPNLRFRRLTNLLQPDDGADRIFVTEQSGRILVFPNDPEVESAGEFLDIRDIVRDEANEEGLLGLAFPPDFPATDHFFVHYSASSPRRSVISRFSVSGSDPDMADASSEVVVLEVEQPYGNHNGGQIEFGPDGFLYVALGDGGSSGDPMGSGQDTGTLLGAILRLDVSGASADAGYAIPPDNPFLGIPGARGEIWAYGLRNPWRFSFDQATGRLWAADVGQNAYEEINVVKRGGNYGWKIMEGLHCFSPRQGCDTSGLELPVAEYGRSEGCSVTGGHVYRGGDIPGLQGAYVYGDFCTGRIWGIRFDGVAASEPQLLVDSDLSITSFGRGVDGSMYVLGRDDGVYLVVPAEPG